MVYFFPWKLIIDLSMWLEWVETLNKKEGLRDQ